MENEIIHKAIDNLQETLGINADWHKNGPLDGLLKITIDGRRLEFVVEVKRELRQHQIYQLIDYHKQYKNLIVIAAHIFPKIKEELRNLGIAYLEGNANIYIRQKNTYCFIDTNKKVGVKKDKANRAFTKTGLKVVFHLLLNRKLVNQTQREIAEKAKVGLGNIPQVINGLKTTGYLIPLNDKEYLWEKREELLDRWINEYATELRPKLKKENYTLRGNWQDLKLNNTMTVWGGEPAADILTRHLRPEKFILYTKENQVNLMKNYRLMPNEEGEIEVLELFWNGENHQKTAPPLLVYAELMLEGGKRNKETAQMIYDEYIQSEL